MTITVHADKTITCGTSAKPFGRIDQDSYQMLTGQRGQTTVSVYATGEKIKIDAPLYVPRVAGSVSEWKINPDFERELNKALG